MHNVTLIPGDGIGPEIANATMEIIKATGVDINWHPVELGQNALDKYKSPLPEESLETIKGYKYALKGPITTPVACGFRSVNVALRQNLNLYANLRPIKSFLGLPSPFSNVDLVVVRENTEDLYAGIEHMIGDTAAESIKIITKPASERIAHFACNYARKHNRKKVTAVHKANIMKLSDGLFLNTCREVAKEYPELVFNDCIIDALCMNLVLTPDKYDVMVLPNLYGDIVSDLCAGLIGGLGLAPSANIGDSAIIFEAVHGSAPDIAGKNIANPTALLLSAAMLLDFLEERNAAQKIRDGIDHLISTKTSLTPDLGGTGTTQEYTKALCDYIAQ